MWCWVPIGEAYVAVAAALQRFVPPAERRRPIHPAAAPLPWTREERLVAGVLAALMALWLAEPLHGQSGALVAVAGALVLTAPRIGAIRFEEAVSSIDWTLLLFMAASLVGGGLAA